MGSSAAPGGKHVLGVQMRGLYLVNKKGPNIVDEFFQKLSESPFLSNLNRTKREVPTDAAWAFDYEIRAELKKPISLQ